MLQEFSNSGVACSRGTVLLRCLKSTLSFRSVHLHQLEVGCIDMLKEAEEQRLEALAAAGRHVSYNMCATSIMCAESSF